MLKTDPSSRCFADASNQPPISQAMFNALRLTLSKGSCLLELGSGITTEYLAEYFELYSVEHNPQYIGKYSDKSNYIHVPTVGAFYNPEILAEKTMSINYRALLVDGPDSDNRNKGFLENVDLFNPNVPWFFDDYDIMKNDIDDVHKVTGREMLVFNDRAKSWSVIMAKGTDGTL